MHESDTGVGNLFTIMGLMSFGLLRGGRKKL